MLSIRKIGVIGKTYRHLNRYRQILSVLFRYGFGDLVETLGIDHYLEVGMQVIAKNRKETVEKLSRAERVVLAIQELGPTFVKLGQVLSTRPDLVPADFIPALARLQDKVPPFAHSDARRIVESQLKGSLAELYSRFEEEPFASASIGQVHRAWTLDEEAVAVKVQRPGIKKIIEVDLEIMLHLATLMERHLEEMSLHRPIKIVEEFARALEKEIDYNIEASHMERVSGNFLDDPTVYIPKVYRDLTGTRVLTMEFVDGIKVSEIDRIDESGLDRETITKRGAHIIFRQVFEHGFFHADPHPGNIFVLPENVVCLIDFGMVGTVDRNTRELFVDLVDAVAQENIERTAQTLMKISSWDEPPDRRAFEKDVSDFIVRHLHRPMKEIEFGKLSQDLLEVAASHRMRIPPDVFLMMKAIGTIETVATNLCPEFDFIAEVAPYVQRILVNRYSPQRILLETTEIFSQFFVLFRRLPREVLEISRLIRKQRLTFNLVQKGLDSQLATYDRIGNRLSFSIIIAGLIIGSSVIVNAKIPPLVFGISLIGILLFLAAAVMGIWLLLAILLKGRL
jgi:ubiquinone biosynthesis protein